MYLASPFRAAPVHRPRTHGVAATAGRTLGARIERFVLTGRVAVPLAKGRMVSHPVRITRFLIVAVTLASAGFGLAFLPGCSTREPGVSALGARSEKVTGQEEAVLADAPNVRPPSRARTRPM
jgi:hypothetical protein